MFIKYQVTLPTLTDKQGADFQVDVNGRLITAPAGNVASGVADTGNPIKIGALADVSTFASVAEGQRVNILANKMGAIHITAPVYAGTSGADGQNVQGFGSRDSLNNVGNPRPTAVGSYNLNGATWDRMVKPNLTARLLTSAATNNATSVKGSAGNVHKITGNNTVAVKKYLKLFNKATAPVPGTDTPVLTFVIPISAAFSFDLSDLGTYFSVGIGYAITAAAADADNTAIGAGDIECMNILYS